MGTVNSDRINDWCRCVYLLDRCTVLFNMYFLYT